MSRLPITLAAATVAVVLVVPAGVRAHITPPRILMSDREALRALVPGAQQFDTVEVRLSGGDRQTIRREWNWRPERTYRVYQGRDEQGRILGSVVFVTEATVHGPIKAAVAVDGRGRVMGAAVVSVQEEPYLWVKPLIDRKFFQEFVGHDARGTFAASEPAAGGSRGAKMTRFYQQVLASLVHRGAIIYDFQARRRT